jgi:superfamily II DNA or RNA helicase
VAKNPFVFTSFHGPSVARPHGRRLLTRNGKVRDILSQSKEAFEMVWPDAKFGLLTGEVKENISTSDVLFASKDTLKNPDMLSNFSDKEFDYIIIDEVHHGEAPSYQPIFKHFRPKFLLGMTATPDRMDRKDIFELFDYNKVFEYTVTEAIENGFLVPFTYYGLKDNIDYSHIRYNGHKYNTQDLERYLIIEARNEQILKEYINKGKGNKAIGFCCSIKHAERMAEYFNTHGIPAIAITSISDTRSKDLADFRNNKYAIAFTVDLFNEGMDFPNVQVILFLRPTESKTVFMQQLGRGLRLSTGKDRLIVLDFISNYKKANKLRDYLAKSKLEKLTSTGRIEKVEYHYAPECQVIFDAEVEEILDRQDREERGISKEDLLEAYFNLAEKLGRKPTQGDINNECAYKVSKFIAVFGSWIRFLRDAGEYTEASYHYPQGVHLGHILYIVKTIAEHKRTDSHIDPKYVRIRGNLDEGRLATFQRQTKYKLQALMEMGIINDDRSFSHAEEYKLELTPEGKSFYEILSPVIAALDLSFVASGDDIPSWDMNLKAQEFNEAIWNFLKHRPEGLVSVQKLFLQTTAVSQMLNYIYKIERKAIIAKSEIYQGFFNAPFVKQHCEQVGIEVATEEGARHRCPFLLNILESIGVITQLTSEIHVNYFLNCQQVMELQARESEGAVMKRVRRVEAFYNGMTAEFEDSELSLLKENFGGEFLTHRYFLQKFCTIK